MKAKNDKGLYYEYDKMEKTLDELNQEQNLKSLMEKYNSSKEFLNLDGGKKLNLDYIPRELFTNLKNKQGEFETKKEEVKQDDIKDIKMPIYNYNFDYGYYFNSNKNKTINKEISSNDNLKSGNLLESNHFNSLYFNDKSEELKTSNKYFTSTNNNDFKISQNDYNLSESINNDENTDINNNIIYNSNPEQKSGGIYFKNSNDNGENISKETSSNVNRRYNEEINNNNALNENNNINNINNNYNLSNNYLLNTKSSMLSNYNSTLNGFSDQYINSVLNISNTLTNNSNYFLTSQNNNFAENIKLRDIENKEKKLLEVEQQRNIKMAELIEKQRKDFIAKEKEREERELKERIEQVKKEREEKERIEREERERKEEEERQKQSEIQRQIEEQKKVIENLTKNKKNEISFDINEKDDNDNEHFFISKEKENWTDYNLSSNRIIGERLQGNNPNKNDVQKQYINIESNKGNLINQKNYNENNKVSMYMNMNMNLMNNNQNYNNNDIFSYINKIKSENQLNNNLNKFSNRTMNNNYNYKTSISFYSKKSQPSDISENNIVSKTTNNFNKNKKYKKKSSKTNLKKNNSSKSIRSINSSKISKTPSKIRRSMASIDNNPIVSLQMLNLIQSNNMYDNKMNNEINKFTKKNEIKRMKSKKDYIFVGKDKIQEKYNIYFNCFVPEIYEEQKEKLLNDHRKMKKSKSTANIKALDDNIGPNLYNEQVEMPDMNYIIYKTNKKINSSYSMNTLNPNCRNDNINNNNYESQNLNYNSNKNIINTINNPFLLKNNSNISDNSNENNNKLNNLINISNSINQTDYPNSNSKNIKNERIYKELYNKAFGHYNYQPNYYFEDYSQKKINWYFNQ